MLLERSTRSVVLALLGVSWFLSCSVDKRKLAGASYAGFFIIGGEAGSEQGGMTSDAGDYQGGNDASAGAPLGGNGAQGGTLVGSGGAPMQPSVIDGCPDLDRNGKGDCTETLVKNPNFAADTHDWSAGDEAFIEWSTANHFDDLPSGSAMVTVSGFIDRDGLVQGAATQCVKVGSLTQVQVFANAFIKSDQGNGSASLALFFFPSQDCSGATNGTPVDAPGSVPDVWQTLNATQAIPDGTQSALVRLAVNKPYRTQAFKVLFDNILIRAK